MCAAQGTPELQPFITAHALHGVHWQVFYAGVTNLWAGALFLVLVRRWMAVCVLEPKPWWKKARCFCCRPLRRFPWADRLLASAEVLGGGLKGIIAQGPAARARWWHFFGSAGAPRGAAMLRLTKRVREEIGLPSRNCCRPPVPSWSRFFCRKRDHLDLSLIHI